MKIWRPKTIRGFGGVAMAERPEPRREPDEARTLRYAFFVWLPYIVLIAVVVAWTGPWSPFPTISWFKLSVTATSSVTQKADCLGFQLHPLRRRIFDFSFVAR